MKRLIFLTLALCALTGQENVINGNNADNAVLCHAPSNVRVYLGTWLNAS